MRILFAFLFLASTAFAQAQPAATSCGPAEVKFDTKMNQATHSLAQSEPGKGLVYVIEVLQRPPGELGTPTIRVGLDGAWIGANRGTSYLSFSVEPGEHHLCTNW